MNIQKPNMPNFTGNRIEVRSSDPLDFGDAKDLAKEKAKELSADPMLLSWYNGRTGQGYPRFECGRGDKPAWFVFSESRGGDILVDVNDGEYIFIYLGLP